MSAELDPPAGARWSLCAIEYQLADGTWVVFAEGVSVEADTAEEAYRALRREVARRRG